jgi:hypothetical protein
LRSNFDIRWKTIGRNNNSQIRKRNFNGAFFGINRVLFGIGRDLRRGLFSRTTQYERKNKRIEKKKRNKKPEN